MLRNLKLYWIVSLCLFGCHKIYSLDAVDSGIDDGKNEGMGGGTVDDEWSGNSNGGVGEYEPMTECDGGIYDPNSKLCWQDPYSSKEMPWVDALDYCERLQSHGHDDWRLPSIGELRSLVRNCPETELGGACNVYDGSDYFDRGKACLQCLWKDECYWDGMMGTSCGEFWSSSALPGTRLVWLFNYQCARVYEKDKFALEPPNTRCVRSGS